MPGCANMYEYSRRRLANFCQRSPGILSQQRALAVHDLVVRQRQDVVLVERVQAAEGELVVMEAAVHRIAREVRQRVVHPAHVPLHAEAEPAHVRRARHHRPRRRLLGDRLRVGVLAIDRLVELPQERDRLQVLVAAVFVRDPLARFAAVVEVEHRGHAVDAQPVDVELVEPVDGARDEEAAHLVAPVIEDLRFPIGMEPLPRVGVLVEVRAVEVGEAVLVRREVRRHPVEDRRRCPRGAGDRRGT